MLAERLREQLLEQLRGEMRDLISTTTSHIEPLDEMDVLGTSTEPQARDEMSTTTVAGASGMLAERLREQLLEQLRGEMRDLISTTTSHTEPLDKMDARFGHAAELKTWHEQSTTTVAVTPGMLAERIKKQLLEQLREEMRDQVPTTSQKGPLDDIVTRIGRLTEQKIWHEESTTTVAETSQMLEERLKRQMLEQLHAEIRNQVSTTTSRVESLDDILARVSHSADLKTWHELSTTTVAETPETLAEQLKGQLLEQLRRKMRDQVSTTTSSHAESLDEKIAWVVKHDLLKSISG